MAQRAPARTGWGWRASHGLYATLFAERPAPVFWCLAAGIVGVVFGPAIYLWAVVGYPVQVLSVGQDCAPSTSTLYVERATGEPALCARTNRITAPHSAGPEPEPAPDFPYPEHKGEFLAMAAELAAEGDGLSKDDEDRLQDHVVTLADRYGRADPAIRAAIPVVAALPLAMSLAAAPTAVRGLFPVRPRSQE